MGDGPRSGKAFAESREDACERKDGAKGELGDSLVQEAGLVPVAEEAAPYDEDDGGPDRGPGRSADVSSLLSGGGGATNPKLGSGKWFCGDARVAE